MIGMCVYVCVCVGGGGRCDELADYCDQPGIVVDYKGAFLPVSEACQKTCRTCTTSTTSTSTSGPPTCNGAEDAVVCSGLSDLCSSPLQILVDGQLAPVPMTVACPVTCDSCDVNLKIDLDPL